MSERLVCPLGHEWDAFAPGSTLLLGLCPVCGGASQPFGSLALSMTPDELPPPPQTYVGAATPNRAATDHEQPNSIGDYQILAELGRGGMGVVYRARQISLNRTVALKMILAGEYASPELRSRFRNEAETVARLQHPNIVQIHEVAEQSGRTFFSLEYVDGQSLAQQLTGAPLAPVRAAELIRTLAKAMHYSHERSVIHRDLKPANVLIAADGTPKIADFGLARLLDKDAGNTRSGSVLGTPSYMAPEQTRGEIHRIGPVTDVYALGAVLYECLTGRPPFRAASPLETARQVLTEEPVPPARLQPGLPRDLETICLKCLQKDPVRRYGSAAALADDVDRFLKGEPVQARPVSARDRIWKWVKRRPTAAALIAVSAAAAVALIIMGISYNARLQRERDLAQANFRLALDAVNQSYTQISEDALLHAPHMEPLRARLLQSAGEFYERFVRERGDDPELRAELGRAYWRLANITRSTGSKKDASRLLAEALRIQEGLVEKRPADPDSKSNLAISRVNYGGVCAELGQWPRAEAEYRIALPIWHGLVTDYPDSAKYRDKLAHTYYALGGALRVLGRNAEAGVALREALSIQAALAETAPAVAEYRRALAKTRNALGDLASEAGDWSAATVAYRDAQVLLEELVRAEPNHPVYRLDRANGNYNLSRAAKAAREFPAAVEYIEKTIPEYEKLVSEHPKVVGYHVDLGMAFQLLGEIHSASDDYSKADAAYQQTISVRERLVSDYPEEPDHRNKLANAHNSLGQVQRAHGAQEQFAQSISEALRITESLAKDYPDNFDYQMSLGIMYFNQGANLGTENDHEREQWFDKTIRTLEPVLLRVPKHNQTRLVLCAAHCERGYARGRLGNPEAMSDWDRAFALDNGEMRHALRARRAITMAHLGKHREAAKEVDELAAREGLGGGALFDLARASSTAATKVIGDPNIPSDERAALSNRYSTRAVELLARAANLGYFRDPVQRKRVEHDRDLDALRKREDFKNLVLQLDKPAVSDSE